MLQKIRHVTRGTGAYIAVFLIALPLSFFGFSWFQDDDSDKVVAEVDGVEIIERDLLRRMQVELRAAQARGADINSLDEAKVRKQIVQILAAEQVFFGTADVLGLDVSDASVRQNIVQRDEFSENGRFSEALYDSNLLTLGYTPQYFMDTVRKRILFQQILSSFSSGAFQTATEDEHIAGLYEQQRTVSYLVLPLQIIIDAETVTEDEIALRYERDPGAFLSKEQIEIKYVEMKLENYFADIPEESIRELYQEQRGLREQERHMAHLMLELGPERDDEAAQRELLVLRQRVLAGESFADLAQEYSDDLGTAEEGGDLGQVSSGDFADFPELEMRIQTLPIGAVSSPVRSESGWHMLYRHPIEIASYEEQRAELEVILQGQEASGRFAQAVDNAAELSFGSSDLAILATNLGREVKIAGPFGREGADEGYFAAPQVAAAAFTDDILEGSISRIVLDDEKTTVFFQLQKYYPVKVLSLEDASERIRKALKREKGLKTLSAQSDQILQRLGQDLSAKEQVAAKRDLEWVNHREVTRYQEDVPRPILSRLFLMPKPGSDTVPVLGKAELENKDIALLIFEAVKTPELDVEARDAVNSQLLQNYNQTLVQRLELHMQEQSEIKIYEGRDEDEDDDEG